MRYQKLLFRLSAQRPARQHRETALVGRPDEPPARRPVVRAARRAPACLHGNALPARFHEQSHLRGRLAG